MTNDTENLILEHLRHMRGQLDRVVVDVQDFKRRISALEGRTADLFRQIADLHGDFAGPSGRLDRIDSRLDKIEQRLDLIEA
jgi:hypothetical protein